MEEMSESPWLVVEEAAEIRPFLIVGLAGLSIGAASSCCSWLLGQGQAKEVVGSFVDVGRHRSI